MHGRDDVVVHNRRRHRLALGGLFNLRRNVKVGECPRVPRLVPVAIVLRCRTERLERLAIAVLVPDHHRAANVCARKRRVRSVTLPTPSAPRDTLFTVRVASSMVICHWPSLR